MKITDIELTQEQARELVSFLQERVIARQVLKNKQEEEREEEERATRFYERVRELAEQTARQHRRLVGIPDYALAEAAWDAWIAHEGYNDPYDVDEYFNPGSDSAFQEGWILAYTAALPKE